MKIIGCALGRELLPVYKYRAEIMRAYDWNKELHELEAPDIGAFPVVAAEELQP